MGVLTMTMDAQTSFQPADLSCRSGHQARAAACAALGYWSAASPPSSPPARGREAPAIAAPALPPRQRSPSRSPPMRSPSRSPSRRSPRTSSSVSSDGSPDRLESSRLDSSRLDTSRLDSSRLHGSATRQTPAFALRDGGVGVLGYPFSYPCTVGEAATPTSPGPQHLGGVDPLLLGRLGHHGLGPLGPLDALSDLYASPLAHCYPHPGPRPWLPWRGLGLAPMGVAPGSAAPAASSASQPGTALKFGMDRILAEDGCGPCATTSPRGGGAMAGLAFSACSRESLPLPASPFGMSALLAPTPLRVYAHVGDSRPSSSPPRGAGPMAGPQSALPALTTSTSGSSSGFTSGATSGSGKRKRSWSRAVFSNLQRKGLEKRFQLQKYITKPDRRQLAATLGLTDAQVKVWFQNRRMKWRHTKESKQHQQQQPPHSSSGCSSKADGSPQDQHHQQQQQQQQDAVASRTSEVPGPAALSAVSSTMP